MYEKKIFSSTLSIPTKLIQRFYDNKRLKASLKLKDIRELVFLFIRNN
jgi:hypothetical protein